MIYLCVVAASGHRWPVEPAEGTAISSEAVRFIRVRQAGSPGIRQGKTAKDIKFTKTNHVPSRQPLLPNKRLAY